MLADPDGLLAASIASTSSLVPTYVILDRDSLVRALFEGFPDGGDALIEGYIRGLL